MAGRKVMIVDNDKDFLGQLEELLNLSGYEMVAVNDAVIAKDVALNTHPEVVILDIKMPGKNGFQVATELRHLTEMRDVPIIAMTGFYTREDCNQLIKDYGINMCLIKPFRPLDVIAKIEELLSNSGLRQS